MNKFKVGDKIMYFMIPDTEIVGEDDLHFILKDFKGIEKKVFKHLVDKRSTLMVNEMNLV